MLVIHAFRHKDQNLDGTVVTPVSKSNHLVGHAIDMNLETPRIASQILFRNTHIKWTIFKITLFLDHII